MLGALAEAQAAIGDKSTLDQWTTPEGTAGYLTFFFLLYFAYMGFGLLGAIEVPTYQLKAESNEQNARDW